MQNSKNLSFYLEHKHITGLRFRVRIKFDWVEFTISSQCQKIHNVGGDNFVYKKKNMLFMFWLCTYCHLVIAIGIFEFFKYINEIISYEVSGEIMSGHIYGSKL